MRNSSRRFIMGGRLSLREVRPQNGCYVKEVNTHSYNERKVFAPPADICWSWAQIGFNVWLVVQGNAAPNQETVVPFSIDNAKAVLSCSLHHRCIMMKTFDKALHTDVNNDDNNFRAPSS